MTTVTGVIVKIDVANRKVDYDSVLLSKSHGDEMEWTSSEAVTVHFLDADPSVPGYNGSPFMRGAFHVPKNGLVSSGPIRAMAAICERCNSQATTDHHHYKYEIMDSNNKVILDPEVIIRN